MIPKRWRKKLRLLQLEFEKMKIKKIKFWIFWKKKISADIWSNAPNQKVSQFICTWQKKDVFEKKIETEEVKRRSTSS